MTFRRNCFLVLVAGGICAASSVSAAPTVINGSFEDVQIGAPFSTNNPADIPGWTHSGTVGDGLLWAIGYSDGGGSVTVAGDGKQFVTLGGGFFATGSATWSTTITGLTAGKTYKLNFDVANEGPDTGETQTMTVEFSSGSSTGSSPYSASPSGVNYWRIWLPETKTFVATAGSAAVDFSVTDQQFDMGLDAVSVVAGSTIPEPSTWAMLLLGFAGLGSMGLRKSSRGAREIAA